MYFATISGMIGAALPMVSQLSPHAVLLEEETRSIVPDYSLAPLFQPGKIGLAPDLVSLLMNTLGDGPSNARGNATVKSAKNEPESSNPTIKPGTQGQEDMILDEDGCPAEEDTLYCDDCGGGKRGEKRHKRERRNWHCKGIADEGDKWKDCYCMPNTLPFFPYEDPPNPTSQELAEDWARLEPFTTASFSNNRSRHEDIRSAS